MTSPSDADNRKERADPRLDCATPLTPANAVAAILIIDGRYLLQLRDDIPGIFFPAHWGCFGGGVDAGETPEMAIVREIREELGISLPASSYRYFTRFDFDLAFSGLLPIWRVFYEVELAPAEIGRLTLQEGAAMRAFSAGEILAGSQPLTPYDSFALWFHINRSRLRA